MAKAIKKENVAMKNAIEIEEIKCAVVGDRDTGKFSLITACTMEALPGTRINNLKESLSKVEDTRDGKITINFRYDTRADDDDCAIDIFHQPLFENIDVVLLCFSIGNPATFKSVITKWKIKIRSFHKSVPIVLVGTKLDLRDDPETRKQLKIKGLTPISHEQGAAMAREINAHSYIECSAMTRINMGAVSSRAVKVAKMGKLGRCSIL